MDFIQTLPTGTFLTSSTNTTSLKDHCSSFTFSSSFGAGVDRRRSETKKKVINEKKTLNI